MAEDKQLTVAELLARAGKNNPDAGTPKRRRRRSLEDGGISVAELTGSFPAVTDAPPQAKHTAVSIDGEEKPSSPAKDPQPEPEKPAPKPTESARPAAKKPAEKPSAAKPAETTKPAAKTPAPTAPAGKKPAEAAKPVEPKKPAPKTPADKKPAPATKPAETKKPEPKTPAAKTPAEQKETAAKKSAAKPSATKPAEPKKPAPKTPATAPAESKKPAEPKKPAPKTPAAKKPAPATKPKPAAADADADDAKTGVLKKVDVQEPKTAAETKRSPVEAPVASSTPGVQDTGVMPAVADSAAGGNVGLAERTDTDLEDQAEEESGGNAVAVIGMAVVGIVIGAVVFFVFEMLWGSLNPWLTGALALAVTAVMIFAVRALRTTRDGMTMTLAGLVGLVTTFGPALISL